MAGVLVLVVVIAVRGVPMSVVNVVDVLIVFHRLVTAAGTVQVVVSSMREVRQRVLVVVVLVRSMGVSLVHVIDVTLALHAGVTAARSVLVFAVNVLRVLGACHGSSLLC